MKKKLFVGLAALFMAFGLASCASDGKTPYIGDNGNWWIGETDTGVPATGPAGQDGKDGKDGSDGNNGSSVTVMSVKKTGTDGLTDTYTITFSDGTATTFTVTNGESSVIESIELTSSSGLVDTYTITFTNGSTKNFTMTNGKNGENLTITSIELKSSEGLIDTYVINYSDGSKFEFVVSNGADGLTPYIGDNGNWWIGDTDTGVLADWEKANNVPLTIYSDGLMYGTRTVNGKTGFVATAWSIGEIEESLMAKYNLTSEELSALYSNEALANAHLVIPNYIGSVPVIGIELNNQEFNFGKITLSRNTVFLAEQAFKNCTNLKEIDFNGADIKAIPFECFYNTSLESIELPDSVTHIFDYAFDGVELRQLDFTNVKYIGNHAFDDAFLNYVYLPDSVEYVGNQVFGEAFVYVAAESKPSNWGNISSNPFAIEYGVIEGDEYLYSSQDNKATVYQYLGDEEEVAIPADIDGVPVTKIGNGFNFFMWDDSLDDGSEKETYNNFKNIQGYIRKLIIGNNVKSIDKLALLNGNMFVYIEDNVEEINIADSDCLIGCFIDADIDDEVPYSLLVLEDSSKTMFKTSSETFTYQQLTASEDEFEALFKADIDYDDIYFDEEYEVYYAKDLVSYQVLAYRNNYVDEVIIKNNINALPVKTIERYAFTCVDVGKIKIGNQINKIKPYAFASVKTKLFVPNNVSIINANGLSLSNGSTIYVEESQKPDDWDTNWNPNNVSVVYSASESDFDNMVYYDNFVGFVKSNGEIELTQYIGSYGDNLTLMIPRSIGGKDVTSIASNFYKAISRYQNVKIYIPSSVTSIVSNAFVLYQNYYYVDFYLEASEIPSTYNTNWCYNSYYGDSSSYINYHLSSILDY